MRVHFIYAHPSPTSFTAAVHERILAGLRTRAHQVDELDLYAARFNPVLSLEERAVYTTSTTRRPPAGSAFWLALIGPSNPSDN